MSMYSFEGGLLLLGAVVARGGFLFIRGLVGTRSTRFCYSFDELLLFVRGVFLFTR